MKYFIHLVILLQYHHYAQLGRQKEKKLTTDQTRHQKENVTADLDDKCPESKNICYLSGN